jgi:hypothetical protein
LSWLALDPSTQPLAERLCSHLGGPHARTENSTAGPGPLAIFWRAIALRGYAITIFIGAFTLDLMAGLSRPAPSLNGLHAKLGFLHIGRDLLNV